jgi:alkylation response protein AidB-like acyl-CoA dehydrogenase
VFCDSTSQREVAIADGYWGLVALSTIHTIFEGTSEIQQLVIARAISGMRVE